MEYSLNLDPSLIATVKKQIAENERRDKLQEFYYNELCQIITTFNYSDYGDYFSTENLRNITSHLYDGQVFEIIKGLREVQHLEEKTQFQKLNLLQSEQAKKSASISHSQKEELTRIQSESVWRAVRERQKVERQQIEREHADEMRRLQMRVVLALDEKVLEQQRALQSAGLTQFAVTTDPERIRAQMKLLDALIQLGQRHAGASDATGC